ncbi:MAG: hypothetical protein ACKVU4_13270 [Phycisphaerales bacterium]
MSDVSMSTRQRILLEITAARDQAEVLLRGLLDAKAQSERRLSELKQADALKAVTGKSAMDNGIASVQRMIETLNRVTGDLKRDLSDQDMAMLEGGDATPPPRR